MAYSERRPTRLNPLAERASCSQVGRTRDDLKAALTADKPADIDAVLRNAEVS